MAGLPSEPKKALGLLDGPVVLHARKGVGRAFFDVGNFADDDGPWGLHFGGADAHALAEGVLAGPEVLGQGVVDEDYELGFGIVGGREEPAAEQRSADGLNVVAFNLDGRGEVEGTGFGGNVAFTGDGTVALVSVGGEERGEADAGGAREGLQAADEFLIELIDGGLGAVLLAGQAVGRDNGVIGTIAEVGLAHFFKTAQEKAGGGEEDEGYGDFGDDKAGAEARVACAGGAGAAAFFQRVVDAGANGGEGRRDAADDTGDDGEAEGEGGNDPVEADVADEGEGLRQEAGADAQGDCGSDEADDATGDAEHEAFEKRLAEEGCSARNRGRGGRRFRGGGGWRGRGEVRRDWRRR